MKYLSVPQTAERWGISSRRIQVLCGENRIPGAVKIGNRWAIPDDEPKPADARIKSGKSIKSSCRCSGAFMRRLRPFMQNERRY